MNNGQLYYSAPKAIGFIYVFQWVKRNWDIIKYHQTYLSSVWVIYYESLPGVGGRVCSVIFTSCWEKWRQSGATQLSSQGWVKLQESFLGSLKHSTVLWKLFLRCLTGFGKHKNEFLNLFVEGNKLNIDLTWLYENSL